MTITILLVDDHAIVRSGLKLLLEGEPDLEVVGEATAAEEAATRAAELEPDVVLMDVVLPGRDGIDATRQVLARSPQSKVLVLSMHDDDRLVREAIAAGASGYLLKTRADAELAEAVRGLVESPGQTVDETAD